MVASTVKISVIVPIYNVEGYLRKCLDSLCNQHFTDFEVWMINDGSPDCSAEIAEEYARQDSRFHLIHKKNGGVASARNLGLDLAQGDYIAFVDGDDFVEPDYLSAMYQAARETGSEVVCCNFNLYHPKQGTSHPHLLTKSPNTYPSTAVLKYLLHDVTMQSYLWNKLWRRDLFVRGNIRFPSIRFEDMATSLQLFYYANTVTILPDALYNYTQRDNSIVHTFRPEVENDFLCSFSLLRLFLEQQGVYPRYRTHFQIYAIKSLFFMWGVIGLYHLQEKNFRGMSGNLRRSTHYLSYYTRKKLLVRGGRRPNYRDMVRCPEEKPPRSRKKRPLAESE